MAGGTPGSTVYLRLIFAILLSAAAAWSAVTLFNHGKPLANATPREMPTNFGLKPAP